MFIVLTFVIEFEVFGIFFGQAVVGYMAEVAGKREAKPQQHATKQKKSWAHIWFFSSISNKRKRNLVEYTKA